MYALAESQNTSITLGTMALKQGRFKPHEHVNVRWKDYFGGTGQMAKALRE